jgi:tetratricopeptide (TPR) repeat protein
MTLGSDTLEQLRRALVDRYVIERELGRGGMAVVYLAQDIRHHRRVAVKVLSPELAVLVGPDRFLREIEITAGLQHPNIVPVHDSGRAGELLFYVMPYVEGESLRVRLDRDGRLLLDDVLQIVREVAGALSYAHQRGIIHRDIKPENILLSDGHAQVADFGIARAISAAERGALTRSGAVIGTPAYMAPEQAAGASNLDGRADLYALAAVAHEALTGERDEPLAATKHADRQILSSRPDVKPRMARALAAPLALERDRRPPTADTWLAMLRAAERRSRSSVLLGVAAALAVGLALVVGWLVRDGPPVAPISTPTIAVLPFTTTGQTDQLDLERALPEAFEFQLQYIPGYRVVSPARVRRLIEDRFGGVRPDRDSLAVTVAAEFSASELLSGSAEVSAGGALSIDVVVLDPATRTVIGDARVQGRVGDFTTLVHDAVLEAFAARAVQRQLGWSPALPASLDAVNAFFLGETSFRRGAYDAAAEQFTRVIERDSTYAPAHFKRMLTEVLRTPPTRVSTAVRDALGAAQRYRDRLDPPTRELLGGYEALVLRGDLEGAIDRFTRIVETNPNAVDAWFILGYLQLNFAGLLGTSRTTARVAFERVHELDPNFAAATAHLLRIAVLQNAETAARSYVDQYLRIDSTSATAELVRMVDSLLYRGNRSALRVLGTFESRTAVALEMIALAAGEFSQGFLDRTAANRAIAVLWARATSQPDRVMAFRLRMASTLGAGRHETADSLLRIGRQMDVPTVELDRWLLLSAVTGVASLGTDEEREAAARRLGTATDPSTLWLVARWRRQRDVTREPPEERTLRGLAALAADTVPLVRSLLQDVDAHAALRQGDSTRALALWKEATRRYAIDRVTFDLAASLWPLNLERARVAAAQADPDEVIAATNLFVTMTGFVDQVAWGAAWPLRARALAESGDRLRAIEALEQLASVLRDANGHGRVVLDSIPNWRGDARVPRSGS